MRYFKGSKANTKPKPKPKITDVSLDGHKFDVECACVLCQEMLGSIFTEEEIQESDLFKDIPAAPAPVPLPPQPPFSEGCLCKPLPLPMLQNRGPFLREGPTRQVTVVHPTQIPSYEAYVASIFKMASSGGSKSPTSDTTVRGPAWEENDPHDEENRPLLSRTPSLSSVESVGEEQEAAGAGGNRNYGAVTDVEANRRREEAAHDWTMTYIYMVLLAVVLFVGTLVAIVVMVFKGHRGRHAAMM